MKTKLFFIVMLITTTIVNAQFINVVNNSAKKRTKQFTQVDTLKSGKTIERSFFAEETKPDKAFEWFEGGNIDYISSGLLQTNARLLKVNIGIPDKFYVPFYIMVGADKQTTSESDEDPNKSTNVNLLSANGGYLNFGLHGNVKLYSFEDENDNTRLSLVYLLGAKSITGKDATTQDRVNMLSLVSNVGFMFQTNAWVPDDETKMGIAWIQAVFTNTFNSENKLKQIYGSDIKKNFYGYNIEAGVQIDNHINLKLGYYKYLNNEDINKDFKEGIFKLSVDFNIAD